MGGWKMAETRHEGGVSYHIPGKDYFEQRELRRHAGVFALWALGVGAVISGDFSGWNLGFSVGGWGGMFVATIVITIMYLGLTYSIAEMSPALPHTGGAYSFARTAFGPWGGFITGIAENIEYVLTPAVVVYFIGTYLTAIFETPASFQPVWWILGYVIFLLALVPMLFGGKIYNSLRKVMAFKIAVVFGFLLFLAFFFSQPSTWLEIVTGFFKFLRDHYAEITIVSGVILIAFGVLLFTNEVTRLNSEVQSVIDNLGLNFFENV